MRILFLTHQGDMAGSTNSIIYLAAGLAEKGHDIFVGCRKESLLFRLLEPTRAQAIPMTFQSKWDRNNMKQIRDAVEKHDIELVNAQSSKDRYTAGFSRLFYGMNAPIVHTRRQIPKSTGLFIQNWFYYHTTSAIVAVSRGVKKELVRLGLPEQHIHVIKNGTPKSKYERASSDRALDLRKHYGIPADATIIGCISRRKKQEQLLQAFSKLEELAWLIFVGIEEDIELRSIPLSEEKRERVIYTGAVDSEEVLHHHLMMTIEVLPSTMEGLSQSLLEAMALGVPVIATDAAGNPDLVVADHNGLLFQDGDIEELKTSIRRLLTDVALYRRLQEQGRKSALVDFEIANVIANYERFFEGQTKKGLI